MDDSSGAGDPPADPGAVARRIEDQRARRGLSEDALASQAGMSPRYLQHLLESGPDFDPGGFLRIATALGLSYRELVEGFDDPPAGTAGAGATRETGDGPAGDGSGERLALRRLNVEECWKRIGGRGVGRIALPRQSGPSVFPVHYAVDARTVVYRTTPEGPAAAPPGAVVSFQVDRTDDRLREGWSVLVTGPAEWIEDPQVIAELDAQHAVEPYVGGTRNQWIRIRPDAVSGRRVEPA